jgi:hypothetical protein
MRLDRAISRNEHVDADSPVEPGYDESRVGEKTYPRIGRPGHLAGVNRRFVQNRTPGGPGFEH